jgi:endonuclease/exonuclease/phosphatase family metal-dependent hydrolase
MAAHFAREQYDLVGVQEAWWLGGGPPVPGLRAPGGWRDSGLGLGGALAAAATLDLVRFSASAGADRLAGKGLLRARFGRWWVGVTHLQAGPEPGVRRAQVAELVAALGDGPAILLGDFNFERGDEEAERLLVDAGLRDVGTGPTWVRRNPFARAARPERYDRVWVRGPVEVVRAEVLPAVWSDHQPVRVELSLG